MPFIKIKHCNTFIQQGLISGNNNLKKRNTNYRTKIEQMKTKLRLRIFMLISLLTILPIIGVKANEVSSADTPILSKELPSYSNLQREKRSIASTQIASLATPNLTATATLAEWQDPTMPTEGTGDHNVGAPVGDVSIIVVILAIVIYSVYRGASTSRRKNNF